MRNNTILVILLVGLLYTIIVVVSDINKLSQELIQFDFVFLPVILSLHIVALFLRAVRQHIFMNALKVRLSFKENFIVNFSGMALIFTPASAGEIIRTYFFKRKYNIDTKKTIPEILFERYMDFAALVAILAIMLCFEQMIQAVILAIPMSFAIFLLYLAMRNRKFFTRVIRFISKFKRFKHFAEDQEEVFSSINILCGKKFFSIGMIITIASYLTDALSTYFVFKGFDFQTDFITTNLILYTSVLFGAISFLPGGFGITEGSLLSILINHGVIFAKASAMILIIRLTSIWFSQFIGFTFFKLNKLDRSEA